MPRPPNGAPSGTPESCDGFAVLPAERLLLLSGTTARPWAEGEQAGALHTNLGRVEGPLRTVFTGERFHLAFALPHLPALQARALEVAPGRVLPIAAARPTPAEDALAALRRALAGAPAAVQAAIRPLLPRRAFGGTDTVPLLASRAVHLEVDRVLRLPGAGLLVWGWRMDLGGAVSAIRLCTPQGEAALDLAAAIPVPRPDVREAARTYAPTHDDWGFCAFVPLEAPPGTPLWLEVELADGETGERALQPADSAGLATIRQVLALPRAPGSRLEAAMEGTLGPAVEALNAARLARPRRVEELAFGAQPARPRLSVVVPLHGRLDFMELQLALFSARPDPGIELIYVLDDPPRRAECEQMALAAEARFGLGFRLVLLEENLGFAPACNEGARRARAPFLCLLNSDVFPLPGEGMAALSALPARLEADEGLGAVGPLLLYEDGTVQHEGMRFEAVRGLPPWPFPIHPRKAHPAPPGAALLEAPAITGACLALRRAEWEALGGFDEGFVIGDFEDSDLCLRLRARGLRCAVDTGARLYHLERQSQEEGAGWRFHATLFNAWRHARRWAGTIGA
ncbi:glycosyltransferase family 2 protein [Roseococcus sp. DSY-14]|uniref:glycosyltransferase family 2 protein n=1 Tax=Roseococcus sp. DSY-14 TaxID=3369650 RepID=UPI00387B07FB